MKFSFSSGPNTAAARVDPRRPDDPLSASPPTMAVLPLADSATERPCLALSIADLGAASAIFRRAHYRAS